jgi:hypothetical protein
MRERLGADSMVYWDDYSEGLFIGGHGSAYSLHVDQLQTSNVGTQYFGHKLVAIWSFPDKTHAILDSHYRSVFAPPLSGDQISALEQACCVAVVPPGAVSLFSGANAHVTCNVGVDVICGRHAVAKPSVCVNSYEAFVNVNEQHVRVMLTTNTSPLHWERCWMDDEDLVDFREDVREQIDELVAQIKRPVLREQDLTVCRAIGLVWSWAHDDRDPPLKFEELAEGLCGHERSPKRLKVGGSGKHEDCSADREVAASCT